MTFETYYKEALPELKQLEHRLINLIEQYPGQKKMDDIQPVLYCKSRIKKPESMVQKLKEHNLPISADTALKKMHDTVGIRIICSFINDVYEVAKWLHTRTEIRILEEKDYIAYPKDNGYRSLHLIVQLDDEKSGLRAEIQIRTIALDFWAALEHQMKYKRHIKHEKTIRAELKRCADEIASVDMSMQTLYDIIRGDDPWESSNRQI